MISMVDKCIRDRQMEKVHIQCKESIIPPIALSTQPYLHISFSLAADRTSAWTPCRGAQSAPARSPAARCPAARPRTRPPRRPCRCRHRRCKKWHKYRARSYMRHGKYKFLHEKNGYNVMLWDLLRSVCEKCNESTPAKIRTATACRAAQSPTAGGPSWTWAECPATSSRSPWSWSPDAPARCPD